MSFLTGKSTPATSANQAYPWIKDTYGGQAQTGIGATNQLAALLGIGGDPTAANAAFDQFRNSTGYQNVFNEAMRGVTNSAAGRGLFGSGAHGRALQTNAANLAQGSFGNYLSQLGGLSGMGMQAGNLIGGAGDQSTGEKKQAGLLDYASQIVPFLSERSLKTAIQKIGEFADGLGIYKFRYLGRPEIQTGVMVDEVERLRPHALGPKVGGFRTVNYGAL